MALIEHAGDVASDVVEEHVIEDTSSGSSNGSQLVSKPNAKAFVWKYFGFERNEKGKPRSKDHPKCRLCRLEIAAKDGNTSNLYSHLRNKHPEEYDIVQGAATNGTSSRRQSDKLQPSLEATWDKTKLFSSSSAEYKDLTKSVTYCLARDMLPISTVEKPGFKAMLRKFNPRYSLPSRNHFTKVSIPELVAETKGSIETQIVDGNIEYFSATTDLWTSAAGDPYITFTCHFINRCWELRSYCLQTHYLPQDHNATNIKEVLDETLELWHLEAAKLVGITTDSGSNVKLACKLLNWRRLSCFGHNLNLAVGKGLDDTRIQRALRICRGVVAAFSRSWKKRRDLVAAQEQKNLPIHKLKLDVVTRWGSAYDMVERVLEQMEAIRVVLCKDQNSSHLTPSWQDCDILESIASALKPLKVMTDALAGESCVTISAVKPILNHIISKLEEEDDDHDTDMTKEIKERIKVDLELRYLNDDIRQLLELASFLDPRFKLTHVSDRADILKEMEIQMLKEMDNENNEAPTCHSSSTATSATSRTVSSSSEAVPPPNKKSKGLSKILSHCLSDLVIQQQLSPQQKIKQEIDQYLTHPQLDISEDPLEWWKSESIRYPVLAKLARKYLCICATSVPSERVFSCGGNIVCDKRTCLKPERVDHLVFLAQNLK